VAKKNRKRNHAIAASLAQQKAAEEQQLPPPPEFVTPIDAVAAATEGVREQQMGMYAEELFTEEDRLAAEAADLAAQRASFEEEQQERRDVTEGVTMARYMKGALILLGVLVAAKLLG
jgi:hypothetical protein